MVAASARLGDGASVAPFAILEEGVSIGGGTSIGPHARVVSGATIGSNCSIFQGAVIGEAPQSVTYKGEPTTVEIGDRVTIREYATLHRGTAARMKTVVGDDCYIMAYAHVGHDGIIGRNVTIANGVQLGGHVEIGDGAGIGGMVAVHQFCRIGTYAFIGGGFRVVQDVPPYVLAGGEPAKFAGLNVVGLRRAGFSKEVRAALKQTYALLYQSQLSRQDALEQIRATLPPLPEIAVVISFVESTSRGLI